MSDVLICGGLAMERMVHLRRFRRENVPKHARQIHFRRRKRIGARGNWGTLVSGYVPLPFPCLLLQSLSFLVFKRGANESGI
jgi:hypothetical protein